MEGAPNFRDERGLRGDSHALNPFLSMLYLLDLSEVLFLLLGYYLTSAQL